MLIPGHVNRKNLLKEMNIPNFNYMTVDDVITFANHMPNMDRKLARQIMESFPDFVEYGKIVVTSMQENLNLSFSANQQSMNVIYDSCIKTLDYCYNRLESDDISEEERFKLMDMILDTNEQMQKKDTENKQFIIDTFGKAMAVLGAVTAGAVTILGAVAQLSGRNSYSEDEEKTYDYEE